MISIRIIALGKIKESYLQDGVAEYVKRLGAMCKLRIVELPDEKSPPDAAPAEIGRIKEVEGQRLVQALATDEYCIALDSAGTQLSSYKFAEKLARLPLDGHSRLAFCIGASYGISESALRRADFCLSFGSMTFPHQLMRLILLEQIYRAFKINRGEPYHK